MQAPAELVVVGQMSHLQRVALPSDSRAVVELRDESDTSMPVIAEQRIELAGRQVPIPFSLAVDRARLASGHRYAVRAGITTGGRPTWVSDPVRVDLTQARPDVGTLVVRPYEALAFSTVFYCGEVLLELGFTDRTMRMKALNRSIEMRQTPTASGARYEAVDDPTTSFWSKRQRGTLVIRGREYPECVEGQAPLPLRAIIGHEPGWRLEIAPSGMTLVTDFGARRYETPAATVARSGEGWSFAAASGTTDIAATVVDRLCRDSMSGMPHPYSVTVRAGERSLQGCGGEPAALLHGGEWIVEDLDGGGIIDRSRATLRLAEGGQVSGRASCNTYTARYELSGEGLAIGEVAVTQRACAPSLMAQEERFLATLRAVRSFDFTSDGALVLKADGQRSIKARRGG
ncbi:MAG TPA: META domain-containing protein [Burkholderiaceae bacterium]|nr:META domain-containing protein [Burkholderiaceae bacterium]